MRLLNKLCIFDDSVSINEIWRFLVSVFKYLNESSSRLSYFYSTVLIFHMYPIRSLLSRRNWDVCWKVTRTLTDRGLAWICVRKFSDGFYHILRRRICDHIYVLIVHISETSCGHKSIIEKIFIVLCQPFHYRWWQFVMIILFLLFFVVYLKVCIEHVWWCNSKIFLLISY